MCFLAILILAGWLRFGGLDERPMHTDEAVLGVKLEEFLESGTFVYDPVEYHGPTLAYSAAVSYTHLTLPTIYSV